MKTKLLNINSFRNHSTDAGKIRKQILTTRLYLVSFIIILFIFVLYTSLDKKSVSLNVPVMDLTEYEKFQMKYKNTLTCPCNKISIEYEQFVGLQPSYHQICSSNFVSQQWINYLFNNDAINDRNFLATASAQFQALASLCQLSEQTVNASLTQFYSTKFISGQLISLELFQNEIQSVTNLFQKSIPQTFQRTLNTIRGIFQGNLFMSAYQTNWKFTVLQIEDFSPVYTNPIIYNNSCSCGTSSQCLQSVVLNNSIINGLVIGCYPLEAMLQSTLECFYNQTCLNLIVSNFGDQSENMTFDILSSINQSGINEKVEQMVDRLFVDNWYINDSYANYFQQCRPLYCTYQFIQNFDIVYILTSVLGLYSGLTVTLKLIIPFIIHIIFKIFYGRQTRIIPFSQPLG
jgi:hypothetical protein